MTCFACRQPTTKEQSRVVWLKDQGIDRRLCKACLEKRGLSLKPRPYPRVGGGAYERDPGMARLQGRTRASADSRWLLRRVEANERS